MTDWNVGDLSFERWVEDLEAVTGAAESREPFALLGISQGAAPSIAYAVRHPERVSQLVLYGAYARGVWRRGDPDGEREYVRHDEEAYLTVAWVPLAQGLCSHPTTRVQAQLQSARLALGRTHCWRTSVWPPQVLPRRPTAVSATRPW